MTGVFRIDIPIDPELPYRCKTDPRQANHALKFQIDFYPIIHKHPPPKTAIMYLMHNLR